MKDKVEFFEKFQTGSGKEPAGFVDVGIQNRCKHLSLQIWFSGTLYSLVYLKTLLITVISSLISEFL